MSSFNPGAPFAFQQNNNSYRCQYKDFDYEIDTIFDGGKDPTKLRVMAGPRSAIANHNERYIFMVSLGSRWIEVSFSGRESKTFSALDGWNNALDYMKMVYLCKLMYDRLCLVQEEDPGPGIRITESAVVRLIEIVVMEPALRDGFKSCMYRLNGAAKQRFIDDIIRVALQEKDVQAKIVDIKGIIDQVPETASYPGTTLQELCRMDTDLRIAIKCSMHRLNGAARESFAGDIRRVVSQKKDAPAKIVDLKRIIDEVSEPGPDSKKVKTEAA